LGECVIGFGEVRQRVRQWAALRGHRPGPEATRAVARAHERPGEDPEEADLLGLLLELDELLWLDPAIDWVVARGGAEVLRDGDDVGTGVVQVTQRLAHLSRLLAHAEDEIRLGDEARSTCL